MKLGRPIEYGLASLGGCMFAGLFYVFADLLGGHSVSWALVDAVYFLGGLQILHEISDH